MFARGYSESLMIYENIIFLAAEYLLNFLVMVRTENKILQLHDYQIKKSSGIFKTCYCTIKFTSLSTITAQGLLKINTISSLCVLLIVIHTRCFRLLKVGDIKKVSIVEMYRISFSFVFSVYCCLSLFWGFTVY